MQQINIASLEELKKKNPNLILIDVREPQEHQELNMGGTLVPLNNILSLQTEEIDPYKNENIYVYCRSGVRSMNACMMLESLGFSKVNNIEGGMNAWKEFKGIK